MSENSFSRSGVITLKDDDFNGAYSREMTILTKILSNVERRTPIDIDRDKATITSVDITNRSPPSPGSDISYISYEINLKVTTANDYSKMEWEMQ